MSFRFPRKEKLKSKKLIDRLFAEGKTITKYPLRLIYLKCEPSVSANTQTGVVAPSRVFKKAVDRNRIKRLIRESYRLHKAQSFNNIDGKFAFLFIYIGREIPTFMEIDRSLRILLTQLIAREKHEEASE